MAPWPSSQQEPSVCCSTSKSPNVNTDGLGSTPVSSNPVRSRQAMQSPFAFNGLPHIEQTPMPVAKGFPMAAFLTFPLARGATRATLDLPALRCPRFGAPRHAVLHGNALEDG